MDIRRKKITNLIWAGLLLAQFLLFYIFSKIEKAIIINEQFFEIQKYFHQFIFSKIPFSIGDIFYVLVIVYTIIHLLKLLTKNSRQKALQQILIILNIIYFVYQIFWGLLYFQPPLIYKLSPDEITLEETKALAEKYLKKCKEDRTKVKEDKNGVFIVSNLAQIKTELIRNQNRLPKEINIKKSTGIADFKPSLFGKLMNYTGILGYYNPFTAEAQYNSNLPATYLPSTLAHESAHQLGYAREQEASFIGFLIAEKTTNPEIRYSTDYFVLKSLLRALIDKHPAFVKRILSEYSVEMKKDRKYELEFLQEHEGPITSIFDFTNNLFLQSNQQEGSITYSYFVDLLVRYERNNP